MANKIVSLLLEVKNKLSPGVKEAAVDMGKLKDRSAELQRELAKLENAKQAAEGLKQAKDAAKEAEKAFDTAQLEVEKLKLALRSEKTPEMALALVKARDAAKGAKAEWNASEKEVERLSKTISRAGGNVNDMATTEKMLAEQLEITRGAIKKNSQTLEESTKHLNEAGASAEKAGISFGGMVAKVGALIGVVAVFDKVRDGLRSLANSVWETGNQFEQFSARLSATEFGYIEEFTKTAPLGLDDVADAFLRLKNFGLDPMDGTLQALVDKNAQLGGSMESLNGIILQLGQGWTKQKLQSQDIIAIMERGIPVWDLLSEAMGKSVQELQDMASAGQLGRKEIKLLIEAMGASAVGESAKQMETMSGAVLSLQGRFTSFYKEIADAGVWDYLRLQMSELMQYIDNLAASGQLQQLAKSIADGFIATAETVKSFITTMYELRGTFVLLGQAWLSLKVAGWASQLAGAAGGFAALKAGAISATAAVKALGLAMKATIGMAIVQGVFEIASAYKTLKKEVSALEKAKQQEADSNAKLAARYKEISEATGVAVESMADLEEAIQQGSIVIDEQTGKYLSAEQAANQYAKSQKEVSIEAQIAALANDRLTNAYDALNESLEQSEGDTKKLAAAIKENLASALEGAKFGAEDFSAAISGIGFNNDEVSQKLNDGLKEALKSLSNEELTKFGKNIEQAMKQASDGSMVAESKIKQLQATLDAVNTAKVENAFKSLGITSQAEYAKIAAASKEAFETIKASGAPIEDQKQAFIAYAKAAIEANKTVSNAQKENVIEQLKVIAIANGMYESLEGLLNLQQQIGDAGKQTGTEIRKGADEGTQGMENLKNATEDTANTAGGAAAALASIFNATRASILELSEAAAAAFDRRMGINTSGPVTEMEALTAAIAATNQQLGETRLRSAASFDATGIGSYLRKLSEAGLATRLEFQQQQLEAKKLTAQLNDTANVTAATITQATNASKRLKLLGDEDLSTLLSALDSANAKLLAMTDNAKAALESLQNELDRLQDNQEAIDRREYEKKKKQLNDALNEARIMGNQEAIKNYTEALKVLEQVRKEKADNARKAAQEKVQKDTKQPTIAKPTVPNRTVDVNLNLGGKRTTVSAKSQSDVDALLSILEQAGMTTL